jgi:hypothetical protein
MDCNLMSLNQATIYHEEEFAFAGHDGRNDSRADW